jgi:uroporphyrinogen-III decarboxylase
MRLLHASGARNDETRIIMNGRERILNAFRGAVTDVVPFAPNIYLWFYFHRYNGTLPAVIAHMQHPFEVLRYMGADILARWDTQWALREKYMTERHQRFVTPHGTLTQQWRLSPETGADFEAGHWWKEWSEYEAVRFMLESKQFEFDAALFDRWVDEVGDDGVMLLNISESPLKRLHWLAGPANASLFIMDHPAEMKTLAQIHEEKALKFLEQVVDHPKAQAFVSHDNLDSAFYPPKFYHGYCDSFFTRAAALIHSRGKTLVVHACGRNKALLKAVGTSQVDCLEGITPPPLGDVNLGAVCEAVGYDRFTVDGGMDTAHLEVKNDAAQVIHTYTRDLFEAMGDKRHFIFASSCMTPPPTPWENLLHFRDAAREYGGIN